MFDIGWSEVLVIATVAIVVVGPKDLPRMLRTFGKTMGTVRRTANDFKRQFDDALREAEREVDLADTRKELKALVGDPLAETKKDFDKTMRDAAKPDTGSKPASETLAKAGEPPVVPSADQAIQPAQPIKGAEAGADAKPAAKTDAS
jgi:sec-independent protein translocase protein TatB